MRLAEPRHAEPRHADQAAKLGLCAHRRAPTEPAARNCKHLSSRIFHRAQAGSKGDFPGPVAVVRGGVSDVREVAEAAALGCAAVAVDMDETGAERVSEVAAWAARLGIETLVRVGSPSAVADAAAAGAKIVCVSSAESSEEEMRAAVAGLGKDVVAVAEVGRAADYSEVL